MIGPAANAASSHRENAWDLLLDRVPAMKPVVLYAEEDPSDVLFLRYAWVKASMQNPLRIVRDGVEAMHYLAGVVPYSDRLLYPIPLLVLLDVNMPRMSGWDVLRWIRANPVVQRLPVVMLSSAKLTADVDATTRLRPDGFLLKPSRLDEWVAVVESLSETWLRRQRAL